MFLACAAGLIADGWLTAAMKLAWSLTEYIELPYWIDPKPGHLACRDRRRGS